MKQKTPAMNGKQTNRENARLFPLGNIFATSGVIREVCPEVMRTSLQRHTNGDWGDLCQHDRRANDLALKSGARLLSVYHTGGGRKFWIITEADRSVTRILLPEEY